MLEKKDNGAGIFDLTPFEEIVNFFLAIEDQFPVSQLWSYGFFGIARQQPNKKA